MDLVAWSARNTKAIRSSTMAPCQLSNTNIPPSILSSSGVRGGSICTVTLILWPGLTVEGLASAIHTNGLSSGSSCCGLEWAPQGPPAAACWAAGNGRDGLDPATGGPLLNKMRPIGRAAQMISSLFLTPVPVRSLRIPSNGIPSAQSAAGASCSFALILSRAPRARKAAKPIVRPERAQPRRARQERDGQNHQVGCQAVGYCHPGYYVDYPLGSP